MLGRATTGPQADQRIAGGSVRSRLAHRTDANHAQIARAFSDLGCSVFSTHTVGDGFPDLVVGCNGVTLLVEIKTETGDLTLAQRKFITNWQGNPVHIVCDTDDAVSLINRTRAQNWHKN